MGFSEDLAAAKTAERNIRDVDVTVNGVLYTLRFTQMDGLDWADEADRHPARPKVLIDLRYGYNLRSLVKAVAPQTGVLVIDGESSALRVDPVDPENPKDPDRVDEWVDLLKALDGAAIQRIGDAIWSLNEWEPGQAVEAAKKALRGSKKASS